MSNWFRKTAKPPLHAASIEDYAMIGDGETAALISRQGSMDWLCWPSFSSPACFAALLGTAENGFWSIRPAGAVTSHSRRYRPGTMIVETRVRTDAGEVLLTDFMPPRGEHSDVVRIVTGVAGTVAMVMDCVLRFDYGLTVPWVTAGRDEIRAVAGPHSVTLRYTGSLSKAAKLKGEGLKTVSTFTLKGGEEACFVLSYAASTDPVPALLSVRAAMAEAELRWCKWSARSTYAGEYTDAVARSLLTLEALTYQPTGGIVAAPTLGLPEQVGGERNWDYRYCWLRDTSFTLLVLMRAGYTEEAIRWRLWLLRAIAGAPDQVQSVYGISGERQLPEWSATWLRGFKDSRPVRIGNAAAEQFQLDVFGELATALHRTPTATEDLHAPASALQAALIDHLCKVWDQPDDGIWETRGDRKHFVHSKVMAWVALDRAVRNSEQYDGSGDVRRWRKNRDMLHKEICKKGFNRKLNAFTQSYGSKVLDASCLRLALVGFLPIQDPRIVGTVDAIMQRLNSGGLILRYDPAASGDGLAGTEGVFLACSFWMVSCLWLLGRETEARSMFERLLTLRNDVGLLSEEYDPKQRKMVGNFPQALSHIALAHAAFTISGQWHPERFADSPV